MTTILASLLSLTVALAGSPAGEPPQPLAPPGTAPPPEGTLPSALVPPAAGLEGFALLASGHLREGRVIRADAATVVLQLDVETQSIFEAASVQGFIPRSVLTLAEVPRGTLPRRGPPLARAVLVDGRLAEGRLVERTDAQVVLEDAAGRRHELPQARLLGLVLFREEARPADPRYRLLEVSSARLPPAGSVQVAATQGTHLSATAGLHPLVSLSLGTAVQGFHTRDYGANAQAALRAGTPLGEHLHLAAGLHASVGGSGRTTGFLSATATWTAPAWSVTAHAGPAFPGLNQLADFGDHGLALGATYQVQPRLALVSETWVATSSGDVLTALAARLTPGRIIIDVGAALAPGSGELLPWLGVGLDLLP